MLQQTRVAAALPYYRRFLRRFPTVRALASAGEQEVLSLWSGLGYYRRARTMHAAAKDIVSKGGGKFPTSAEELRTLPGIGRYTAAAIASICFGEATAVVDGNVERVLDRLAGRRLNANAHWKIANALIHRSRPGDFNQAVMELGALICTPKDPKCGECPLFRMCGRKGTFAPAAPSERNSKSVSYALDESRGAVRLVQRTSSSTSMAGMWELPPSSDGGEAMLTLKHSITNTDFTVKVLRAKASEGTYVKGADLAKLPLTGLTRKVLRRAGHLL